MRHGFLLINKPIGPTSHDIVAMVRKQLSERKVGHLGTLDPAASGLLVLAVGAKALKVVELFKDLSKEYVAQVMFGAVSSTYDREGIIEKADMKPGVSVPDESDVRNAIADRFLGKIDQVPPAYSAVQVGGERAYRKMRQRSTSLTSGGRGVDLPSREVQIEKCDIQRFAYPVLELRVVCSSGTYIRSLAHDLGQVLRCGGYLSGLLRTKVGPWKLTSSVAPDQAKWTDVISLKEVLKDHRSIELTDDEAEDIRHGRVIERGVENDTIAWHEELPIALLVSVGDGESRARKVF